MSDLEELRRSVAEARAAEAEADAERVRAVAALRLGERALAEAKRTGDARAERQAARELERLGQEVTAARDALRRARGVIREGLPAVEDAVDPRERIPAFPADVPILLFPVRLETRFGQVDDPRRDITRTQLWVRIFPDTVSIDTFGDELTESEVTDAQAYWTELWRAAGDEAGERGAWRALAASHGSGRAAWIVASYAPTNPEDRPETPEDPFVEPQFPPVDTTPTAWNRAPRAVLLPDRFVLVTENGSNRTEHLGRAVPPEVFTGPDPLADAADQIRPVGARLEMPDELRWLVDFDRAVEDGLGFRIDLGPDEVRGFDRVYAVGVRLLTDAATSATELETLLRHHRFSRGGFALVPQGSATNNTEEAASAHSPIDDPDAAFDALRAGPVPLEADPRLRRDGQWLADLLGVDPAMLDGVPNAHGVDQRDARAMQALLWPATMGYLTGTMLEPVFEDETVEQLRWFFTHHVRGRGSLPAVRVGDQPYGILATSAVSRSGWLRSGPQRDHPGSAGEVRRQVLLGLDGLLRVLRLEWDAMTAQVPSLGAGGAPSTDAHATLLGILGLHPTSVEFHTRYAQSLDHLVNQAGLSGWLENLYRAILQAQMDTPALELLERLGHRGDRPPLLDLYFHGDPKPLTGPLIDDRPLSETEPIRVWATGDRNYLQWLLDAAETSLDTLRTASGFVAETPNALLFLLAKHGLVLGYAESARGLYRLAGFDAAMVRAMRTEPPFVHVAPDGPSESRYAPLFAREPRIAPGQGWTVATQVTSVLRRSPGTRVLRDQVEALELLTDASTARLERALAEHLDTVSYRADAWQLGLVGLHLELMRGIPQDDVEEGAEPTAKRGIHLGAWGWIEEVRPHGRALEPVRLDPDLAAVFEDGPPLRRDPANGGHLLAPSLNQAVTASVLRSAYLADANPTEPGAMAVNLSSERVRKALAVLDGMRQGQSLAELLGYALERGLHDRSGFAEVDEFIFDLRRAFPLRARHLSSTLPPEGTSIEAVEARNVVNGLTLVEHVQKPGNGIYPFGLPNDVMRPDASPAQRAALEHEFDALRDLRDAVGDLALAESVHQATQGSPDRAAATLRSMESGHQPPEPEVVRTPAGGTTITQRVGIQLTPTAAAPGATPRAVAEPTIEAYIAAAMPPLGSVGCLVVWADPVDGSSESLPVTLADLGLRASDVVEVLRTGDPSMTELDDRIVRHMHATAAPRPDARLEIRYREAESGKLPIFELAALAGHLRGVLTAARPLRATDVTPPGAATDALDAGAVIDPTRLAPVRLVLDQLASDVQAPLATWTPLLEDTTLNRDAIIAGVDAVVDAAVELLERGARLAIPGSRWGHLYESREGQYRGTITMLRERGAAWQARITEIETALQAYDALPGATPDDERFAELARIEGMIAARLSAPAATPALQRAAVGALQADFVGRRTAVMAVADGSAPTLVGLRAAVAALLPVEAVDREPIDLTASGTAMITLLADAIGAVRALGAELTRRASAADEASAAHAAATDDPGRLEAMTALGEALLGEGFRMLPTFRMPAAAAAEWTQALATSPDLLDHATTLGVDFPVDDWVHSASRVRPAVRHLEQAGLTARALGLPEPEPVPVQLPHRLGEAWLAMEFPDTQDTSGERLLYTAVYPAGFDPAADLCGLLVDAWTEVLPSDRAIAGLAFHFDRPSSEAPQSLLLVTPASGGTAWAWDDLRQAIPDTMRLARHRAVEPVHLEQGAGARFLPATVSAITMRGVSMSLLYAINNDVQLFARNPDA
jgi:hypothetical protein